MTGEEIRNTLSTKIKNLRKQNDMFQAELAKKAEISIPFLSAIERGTKWPHPDSLAKLSNALNVEVYELFAENTKFNKTNANTLPIMKELIENERKLLDAAYTFFFQDNQ